MAVKLFVADDSVTIQKVIELAFAGTDTSIQSVTSGDEALDAIADFRPDIVLADVCMPGMNGYEICKQIKLNPDLFHIPVVLLVGTFDTFDDSEASRVGCDARLTKPFDTSELIEVVRNLVGGNMAMPEMENETNAHPEETAALRDAATVNDIPGFARITVSKRSLASFLGSDRVLDLFDEGDLENKSPKSESSIIASEIPPSPRASVITAEQVSDEVMDKIIERVVKKMSTDVISEIAWEIVPELSEILIKRSIEENRRS